MVAFFFDPRQYKCKCTYQKSTRDIFVITNTKDKCECKQDDSDENQGFDEDCKQYSQ